jgi:hypothetical protein
MIVRRAWRRGEASRSCTAATAPAMMLVLSMAAPGCAEREAAPMATGSAAVSAHPPSREERPTGYPEPTSTAPGATSAPAAGDEGASRTVERPTPRDSGAGKDAERIDFDDPLPVTGAPRTAAPR